jgi:anti-sigma regulatory factor (Ser/Thr protein kinase)
MAHENSAHELSTSKVHGTLHFSLYSCDPFVIQTLNNASEISNQQNIQLKSKIFQSIEEAIENLTYNQDSKLIFIDFNRDEERAILKSKVKEIYNDPWLHGTLIIIITNEIEDEEKIELLNYGVIDIISINDLTEKSHLLFKVISTLYYNLKFRQFSKNNFVIKKGKITLVNDLSKISNVCDFLIANCYSVGIRNLKILSKIYLTLYELISNAIEHGNCNIGYFKKAELIRNKITMTEHIHLIKNSNDISSKKVTIYYSLQNNIAKFQIDDEGIGFDVKGLIQTIQNEKIKRVNGRGILLTKQMVDSLKYNKSGNKVRMVLYNTQELIPPTSNIFRFSKENPIELNQGDVLIQDGKEGNFIYYIVYGKFAIYKNDCLIATLNHEDIFVGEMSFLEESTRSGTVIAMSHARVLPITKKGFVDMIKAYPYTGIVLARLLTKRIIRRNSSD